MIDYSGIFFDTLHTVTPSRTLVGNASTYLSVEIQFQVHWETENTSMLFLGNEITRNDIGGSFIDDGFNVDDIFIIPSGNNAGTYEILAIPSIDKLVCGFYNSGSGSSSTSLVFVNETVATNIYGITPVKRLNLYYNLIQNASSVNFQAEIDSETRKFSTPTQDFDSTPTASLAANTTNKSWLTGTATNISNSQVVYQGLGAWGYGTGYEQYFIATLEFYIDPVLLEGFLNTNGDIDTSLIADYYQANCLRFVSQIEASFDGTIYHHDTSQGNGNSYNNTDGDTGYLGEYRNGGTPDYSISSTTIVDPYGNVVSNLSSNLSSNVTIVVADSTSGFTSATKFDVQIWEMPDEADYQNNTNTMFENFDVSVILNIDETAGAQSNNNISNFNIVIDSSAQATLTMTVAGVNEGRKYVLIVETRTQGVIDLNITNSVALKALEGTRTVNLPVSDVFNSERGFLINEHPDIGVPSKGYTDYKGWAGDDVFGSFVFSIKKLTQNSLTVSFVDLDYKIMAIHNTDSSLNFIIEEATLDTAGNQSAGRGYDMPNGYDGDKKFIALIHNDSTNNYYNFEIGQIFGYEDWQTLITANSDFPNGTKDVSEYFTSNYSVKIFIDVNTTVSIYDVTFRRIVNLDLKEEGEYFGCEITGEIQTFINSNSTNLGGQISPSQNTLVKAIFYGEELFPCVYAEFSGSGSCSYSQIISGSGSASFSNTQIASGCYQFFGEIYLDNESNGGRPDYPKIISSVFDFETSEWIGLSGDLAKIVQYPYANPPRVEVSAILDVSELDLTIDQFNIYGRLGEIPNNLCKTAIVEPNSGGNYQNNELIGKTSAGLLVFFDSGEMLSNGATSFNPTTGTLSFGMDLGTTLKICCTISGEDGTFVSRDNLMVSALIGLTIDDFLFFINGQEFTTTTGSSHDSGTGVFSFGSTETGDYKVSLHVATISTTISSVSSYTDTSLIGLTIDDLLVFVEGSEFTTDTGASFNTNTGVFSFGSTETGRLKIILI